MFWSTLSWTFPWIPIHMMSHLSWLYFLRLQFCSHPRLVHSVMHLSDVKCNLEEEASSSCLKENCWGQVTLIILTVAFQCLWRHSKKKSIFLVFLTQVYFEKRTPNLLSTVSVSIHQDKDWSLASLRQRAKSWFINTKTENCIIYSFFHGFAFLSRELHGNLLIFPGMLYSSFTRRVKSCYRVSYYAEEVLQKIYMKVWHVWWGVI